MATRTFWIWHMHNGKYGDPKAMSCTEIAVKPLWFWEECRSVGGPPPRH